jgi:L-alanine-DL-glutamate epimerase-like enolase superfamily enzyme
MPAQLQQHELHVLRLDYTKPLRWAGHLETGMDLVLLVLRAGDGAIGVAETPIRLKWHSASIRSFVAALEDVVLPALANVDLLNAAATGRALARVREHPLAKSLVDMACWDLRAHSAQTSLWRMLGAEDPHVPLSFTVNRSSAEEMGKTALRVVERFGVRALKVKTGQALEIDRAALQQIRSVVGSTVELFADSNSAHSPNDLASVSSMLAEFGVSYFEDPCPLMPDRQLHKILEACRIPILVDDGCRSLRDAVLFLDAGAQALSVKTMKSGLTESLAIAEKARDAHAMVSVGISATSALGAITAMSLAAALPREVRRIPCEETFFLNVPSILHENVTVVDGAVQLPDTAGLHGSIDWDRVRSLKI